VPATPGAGRQPSTPDSEVRLRRSAVKVIEDAASLLKPAPWGDVKERGINRQVARGRTRVPSPAAWGHEDVSSTSAGGVVGCCHGRDRVRSWPVGPMSLSHRFRSHSREFRPTGRPYRPENRLAGTGVRALVALGQTVRVARAR
jgi:hypothetical protein